jgi:hypothetical protein
MSRKSKFHVEVLEVREVMSLFGNPWPDAEQLKLSFAADGTRIGGANQFFGGGNASSSLFATMRSVGADATWQTEILRAFQTWAVNTNINIGLVADNGTAFGIDAQNDQKGDLRIGAFKQPRDVLAVNNPYSAISGPWSGSLFFNAAYKYSGDEENDEKGYDLFTATLNEAGNIFGLADNKDRTSALYGKYIKQLKGLNKSDIAAIQRLYGGSRRADAYEGVNGNDTEKTAALINFNPYSGDGNKLIAEAMGDITAEKDVDYYRFTMPAGQESMTVCLETAGVSLFTGKVTVLDSKGKSIAAGGAKDPLNGNIQIRIDSSNYKKAVGGETFYVRVEANRDDVFGIGTYRLRVGAGWSPSGATSAAASQPSFRGDDGGTNDTSTTSTVLNANGSGRYFVESVLAGTTDVDFYRVQSRSNSTIMTVEVRTYGQAKVPPVAEIYDAGGNLVAGQLVICRESNRFLIQANIEARLNPSDYYVRVVAASQAGEFQMTDYKLDISFDDSKIDLETIKNGDLSAANPVGFTSLNISASRQFLFSLGVNSQDTTIESGARLIIFDSAKNVVGTLTAESGQATTMTLFLMPGIYTIMITGGTKTGIPIPRLDYKVKMAVLNDPIDPYAPADPTVPPPPVCSSQDNGSTYYASLGLIDPWNNPWLP